MFQKFNFDTEWAVRLISKITNDEDLPIEGDTIVKQVGSSFFFYSLWFRHCDFPFKIGLFC